MSSKKTSPVQIRFTEDERAAIDEIRGDRSVASVMREALALLTSRPCGHCKGTGRLKVRR